MYRGLLNSGHGPEPGPVGAPGRLGTAAPATPLGAGRARSTCSVPRKSVPLACAFIVQPLGHRLGGCATSTCAAVPDDNYFCPAKLIVVDQPAHDVPTDSRRGGVAKHPSMDESRRQVPGARVSSRSIPGVGFAQRFKKGK